MKICKDCKHFKALFLGEPHCDSPNIQLKIDPVTGKERKAFKYCSTIRDFNDMCGSEGHWFEEKK